MDDLTRLRFYLRDPDTTGRFFKDEELQQLVDYTGSFEEAVGLGWLVKAAGAITQVATAGALTSRTIGKVSEHYSSSGGGTSGSSALAMSNYWFGRSGRSIGRWWTMEPGQGFIGEQVEKIKLLDLSEYYDLSRLIP